MALPSRRSEECKMDILSNAWRRRARQVFVVTALAIVAAIAVTGGVHAQSADPNHSLRLPVMLAETADGKPAAGAEDALFVPGEILAGIHGDVVGAAAALEQTGAVVAAELWPAGDAGVAVYVLKVTPGTELEAVAALERSPSVAYAEPNWIVRAAKEATPDVAAETVAETPFRVNDPLYRTWQWHLPRIRASRAWALSGAVSAQAESAGAIRVAVIDSGVDVNHPDLSANVDLGLAKNYFPNEALDDDCGHGTHVIGLIGATTNNSRGVAGAALDVTVVPFKALHWAEYAPNKWDCVGPTNAVVWAIYDAANAGYDIINLSLELSNWSDTLATAVSYAESKGVLLIAAAGNCQTTGACPPPVRYPAAYPQVMAIAATGYYDTRAYYSAIGAEIDLAAPGGDGARGLYSTWSDLAALRCTGNYQIISGGAYCASSGTSMAAAVATGAAAQVWSVRPDLRAGDIWEILTQSARPISGSAQEVGSGLLDAERAVRLALHSGLTVAPVALSASVPISTAPFTRELLITNPSLEPIQWAITRTQQIGWLTPHTPVSGTVRYGEPVRAGLTISPTYLADGNYSGSFWVEGEREDKSRLVIPVAASLGVYTPLLSAEVYLPSLTNAEQSGSSWPLVAFSWEAPGASRQTQLYLTDNSSAGIMLPFTVTAGGVNYADARVYSDGVVALPASARIERANNECLPIVTSSGPTVFGWWADLNPGASDARVSTFQPRPDRFVVEYLNVPSAAAPGGQPLYRVSFQIVLYDDGRIGVNYRRVPGETSAPPAMTAGIQTQDGRFFNQLACVTASVEIGQVPRAYQSMLFGEGDLF